MNNYHTLKNLLYHLNDCMSDAIFCKAESIFKNQIDLVFQNHSNGEFKVVVNCSPNSTCIFKEQIKQTRNTNIISFFDNIKNAQVDYLYLTQNDRIITIAFTCNKNLVIKLFGNRPNVFLLNEQEKKIIDSFKKPNTYINTIFEYPKKGPISAEIPDQWTAESFSKYISDAIPTINRSFLRHFVKNKIGFEDPERFVNQLLEDLNAKKGPFNVYDGGIISTIRPSFLGDFQIVNSFDDINEAIKWSFYNQSSKERFNQKYASYERLLTQSIKRKKAVITQLKGGEKSEDKANLYENIAHSLMAFGQQIKLNEYDERTKIKIPKVENSSEYYEISLDPKISVVQTAEKYYARARHQRQEGLFREQQMAHLDQTLHELQKAYESFSSITKVTELRDWEKKNKQLISGSRKEQTTQKEESAFRVIKGSKYDVWVGKNAQSNDELLRKSHKEDIWMHARGVAGSHVVIRMANQKDWPSTNILEEVASVAAFYSKLKGSALVPVIMTKRKYVRKPKNAAAGMVKIDKEESILVKPKKELII